jgi:hypothetical protein
MPEFNSVPAESAPEQIVVNAASFSGDRSCARVHHPLSAAPWAPIQIRAPRGQPVECHDRNFGLIGMKAIPASHVLGRKLDSTRSGRST